MNIRTGIYSGAASVYWFLVILFFLCLVLFDSQARADQNWRPSTRNFQAREISQDCSVYRSVLDGTKEQLSVKQQIIKEYTESTQREYAALEQCAKGKGILDLSRSEGDRLAMEQCPENYQAWLNEGMHLSMAEEETGELSRQAAVLDSMVRDRCVPTVVAVNR